MRPRSLSEAPRRAVRHAHCNTCRTVDTPGICLPVSFLLAILLFTLPAFAQMSSADTTSVFVSDTLQDTTQTGYAIIEDHEGSQQNGIKKLKIVRRAYNYREQIGFALGMMAFIMVIFTTTQSWNPD